MIACMPSRYEVTQLTVTGEWSTPNFNEVSTVFFYKTLRVGGGISMSKCIFCLEVHL